MSSQVKSSVVIRKLSACEQTYLLFLIVASCAGRSDTNTRAGKDALVDSKSRIAAAGSLSPSCPLTVGLREGGREGESQGTFIASPKTKQVRVLGVCGWDLYNQQV